MRAQGVSFARGPLASLRSPHQPGPMEMSTDTSATFLCMVAFFSMKKHVAPSRRRWLLLGHLLLMTQVW